MGSGVTIRYAKTLMPPPFPPPGPCSLPRAPSSPPWTPWWAAAAAAAPAVLPCCRYPPNRGVPHPTTHTLAAASSYHPLPPRHSLPSPSLETNNARRAMTLTTTRPCSTPATTVGGGGAGSRLHLPQQRGAPLRAPTNFARPCSTPRQPCPPGHLPARWAAAGHCALLLCSFSSFFLGGREGKEGCPSLTPILLLPGSQ